MLMVLTRRLFLGSALAVSSEPLPSAEPDISYIHRADQYGERFEGKRSKVVGGLDIELISAAILNDQDTGTLPDTVDLGFFLKDVVPVFITVRELNNSKYYWLDQVHPPSHWIAGTNQFKWPTGPVLRLLQPLALTQLATLVRLDVAEPSLTERVAPAVLFSSSPPLEAKEYVFSFRTGERAKVTWFLERVAQAGRKVAQSDGPIFTEKQRAFAVPWHSAGSPAGLYRLTLTVTRSSDNKEVPQTVSFYHQPKLS